MKLDKFKETIPSAKGAQLAKLFGLKDDRAFWTYTAEKKLHSMSVEIYEDHIFLMENAQRGDGGDVSYYEQLIDEEYE